MCPELLARTRTTYIGSLVSFAVTTTAHNDTRSHLLAAVAAQVAGRPPAIADKCDRLDDQDCFRIDSRANHARIYVRSSSIFPTHTASNAHPRLPSITQTSTRTPSGCPRRLSTLSTTFTAEPSLRRAIPSQRSPCFSSLRPLVSLTTICSDCLQAHTTTLRAQLLGRRHFCNAGNLSLRLSVWDGRPCRLSCSYVLSRVSS